MAATIWRGQLTFGLVSFPVRLYTAARKERIRLHHVRKNTAERLPDAEPDPDEEPMPGPALDEPEAPAAGVTRLKQEFVASRDERPVPREETLKGYAVAPEQYVTFTDEELRKLRPATSPDMQILRAVRLADIDPVYFDTSYYVVADSGGERAYALLFAALQQTQYVALARVAMHGREHIMVVRPGAKGLLAHTMFFSNEIRAANEYAANTGEVAPKELDLAKTFVNAIAGPFAPEEFKDSYKEQIQNLISSKVARKEVARSTPESAEATAAPVVDIMEALRKSLEVARKPAKSEPEAARRTSNKVTEMKSKAQRRKA